MVMEDSEKDYLRDSVGVLLNRENTSCLRLCLNYTVSLSLFVLIVFA